MSLFFVSYCQFWLNLLFFNLHPPFLPRGFRGFPDKLPKNCRCPKRAVAIQRRCLLVLCITPLSAYCLSNQPHYPPKTDASSPLAAMIIPHFSIIFLLLFICFTNIFSLLLLFAVLKMVIAMTPIVITSQFSSPIAPSFVLFSPPCYPNPKPGT